AQDKLGDAGRLGRACDLEGGVDLQLVTAVELGHVAERAGQPDARADGYRRGEPQLVQSVVDAGADVLDDEHLGHERDDEAEGEVAVHDRRTEGARRAGRLVEVDRVVISGQVGESPDLLGGDGPPGRRTEAGTGQAR